MGATLKGVSKTMATISKPYRFWSVRISGARRLQEFERVMAKVGVKFRTVRHFFFSDCVLDQGKPPRGKHYTECIVHASDAPDLKSFGSESTWKITTNQHALGIIKRDLLSRVLAYISPHLKTLIFILTASEALDAMSRHTFGSLQSIRIYMIDSNPEGSAIPHRMRMPELRTLWLGTSNKMSSTAPTAYSISLVRLAQEYSDVLESVVLDGVAVYADTRYVLRHLLGRPDIKLVPPPLQAYIPNADWELTFAPNPITRSTPLACPIPHIELRAVPVYASDTPVYPEWMESQLQSLEEDGVRVCSFEPAEMNRPSFLDLRDTWYREIGLIASNIIS
jgi:hypothetical protein